MSMQALEFDREGPADVLDDVVTNVTLAIVNTALVVRGVVALIVDAEGVARADPSLDLRLPLLEGELGADGHVPRLGLELGVDLAVVRVDVAPARVEADPTVDL